MPTLLEQAIIDASELREAALKNAESSILEKYSTEVKGAVDALLEQEMPPVEEEEMMGPESALPPEMMAMMGAEGAPPMAAGPLGDIPPAAGEGVDLCPCPDDEEEEVMEFELSDLVATANNMPTGEPVPHEMLAMQMGAPAEEGTGIPMMAEAMARLSEEIDMSIEEEIEFDEDLLFEYEDEEVLEEEIDMDDISIDSIASIVEKVMVDTSGNPTGWSQNFVSSPSEVVEFEKDLETAGSMEEEESGDENAIEFRTKLQESIGMLGKKDKLIGRMKAEKKSLLESNRELKETFMLMKEEFEKTNLSNAKLLYTNRTLKSTSLNERQKNRIVESIQSADTIEEAKVIFETLQSAVGGSVRSAPKSLNEAISRPSNSVPRRRNERSMRENVLKDRFKALAGIKNK
jgi:hypothetical protein